MTTIPGVNGLAGLRVVDFCTMVAGPLATAMLAENGAEVIKVESLTGDGMRGYGATVENMSSLFLFLNRGKRSIAVDAKTGEGRECVRRLVADADVVVHQFRGGVAERLGIGYDDVVQANPGVLYARLSGFGEQGPFSGARAYDPVLQAYAGLPRMQGQEDATPQGVSVPLADKVTGLIFACSLMVGLAERAKTGASSYIDGSMLQSMLWWLWPEAIRHRSFELFDQVPMSYTNASSKALFETADGRYISAWAISDPDWASLAKGLGREDWILHPEFGRADHRNIRISEMVELIRGEVSKHSFEELSRSLKDADAIWAPVNDPEWLLEDEQILANQMYVEMAHGPQGLVRQPRFPFRFSGANRKVLPAPQLGEHTIAILHERGFDTPDIETLLANNVVTSTNDISEKGSP